MELEHPLGIRACGLMEPVDVLRDQRPIRMSRKTHRAGERSPVEVGIRALRAELSRWLDVARDRDVIITDRGQPVARLVPIGAHPGLERLVADGQVTLPERPASCSRDWIRVRARGSVADLVAEQRR